MDEIHVISPEAMEKLREVTQKLLRSSFKNRQTGKVLQEVLDSSLTISRDKMNSWIASEAEGALTLSVEGDKILVNGENHNEESDRS